MGERIMPVHNIYIYISVENNFIYLAGALLRVIWTQTRTGTSFYMFIVLMFKKCICRCKFCLFVCYVMFKKNQALNVSTELHIMHTVLNKKSYKVTKNIT